MEHKYKNNSSQTNYDSNILSIDPKRMSQTSMRIFENPLEIIFAQNDIIEESAQLFQNFLREEIIRAGHLQQNIILNLPIQNAFKDPIWIKYGNDLRQIADAFSNTKEREQIYNKANQVSLCTLTLEHFMDLLTEIFCFFPAQFNITNELRIVILFLFSSDLIIRTIKNKSMLTLQLFNSLTYNQNDTILPLFQWTVEYIKHKLSAWVQSRGGWKSILDKNNHNNYDNRLSYNIEPKNEQSPFFSGPKLPILFSFSLGISLGILIALHLLRQKAQKL
ncbi:unnamed protein product [Gordionus sp. m RMFG-2023]|uniref:apoptosis regulator BAX-like n=1 Tax=Gordionus sp. m RMFG-2023 TaxID=3053472 RepID=UPI0030DF35D6